MVTVVFWKFSVASVQYFSNDLEDGESVIESRSIPYAYQPPLSFHWLCRGATFIEFIKLTC